MSDSKLNRFEIDLDEIERQLRRSAQAPSSPVPAVNADPLAELARIVGQNDPFRDILGEGRRPAERPDPRRHGPVVSEEERDILGADDGQPAPPAPEPLKPVRFDPVIEAYGSRDNVLSGADFEPLPPNRGRGRLVAVLAVLGLAVLGTAGGLVFLRKGGGSGSSSSGAPPLIKADNAPLKIAPANPGGMEIPDQNKQIYERGASEGKSRVVDRQEQPVDVREVARSLPEPEPPPPAATRSVATAPAPAVSSTLQTNPGPPSPTTTQPTAPPRVTVSPNAVLSALGEPRRVRTVVVRPDGAPFGSPPAPAAPEGPSMTIGNAPAPVPVATVSVPLSAAFGSTAAAPAQAAATPAPTGPVIAVLPPQRPRPDGAAAPMTDAQPVDEAALNALVATDAVPDQATAVRVIPPARPRPTTTAALAPDAAPSANGAADGKGWAVQIATRPTERDARTTYDRLSDKYPADLGGKPATVTQAQVNGKTVFRVRVTPMSRDDATNLCTRLKASGAACFVAAN